MTDEVTYFPLQLHLNHHFFLMVSRRVSGQVGTTQFIYSWWPAGCWSSENKFKKIVYVVCQSSICFLLIMIQIVKEHRLSDFRQITAIPAPERRCLGSSLLLLAPPSHLPIMEILSLCFNIAICVRRYCRIISCYDCAGNAAQEIWLHGSQLDMKESIYYVTYPCGYDVLKR